MFIEACLHACILQLRELVVPLAFCFFSVEFLLGAELSLQYQVLGSNSGFCA